MKSERRSQEPSRVKGMCASVGYKHSETNAECCLKKPGRTQEKPRRTAGKLEKLERKHKRTVKSIGKHERKLK